MLEAGLILGHVKSIQLLNLHVISYTYNWVYVLGAT